MVTHAALANLAKSLEGLDELADRQARVALLDASPSAGAARRGLRHAEKKARKAAATLFECGNIEEANALMRLAAKICH